MANNIKLPEGFEFEDTTALPAGFEPLSAREQYLANIELSGNSGRLDPNTEYGRQRLAEKQAANERRADSFVPSESNTLLDNLLKAETLDAGLGSAAYGGERVLNAASAGLYGLANRKLGGAYDERDAAWKELMAQNPRWLRNLGRAGTFTTDIAGGLASPIYKANVPFNKITSTVGPTLNRILNMANQAGIYGAISNATDKESLNNIGEDYLYNAAIAGVLGTVMAGIPKGFSKVTGVSSGVGAETMDLARKAGQENPAAFRQGRSLSATDVADKIDDAYYAINSNAQKAFGAGKNKIIDTPMDKKSLSSTLDDWFSGKYNQYGTSIATPEVQDVYNKTNKLIKKFAKGKAPFTVGKADAIKQAVWDINAQGNAAQGVKKQLYKLISKEIESAAPTYRSLMKPYEESRRALDSLRQATGVSGNVMTDVQKSRIANKAVKALNTPEIRDVIRKSVGADFPYQLAGYATKSYLPASLPSVLGATSLAGVAASGNPVVLGTLPLMSPKLMGNASYLIGRGQNVLPTVEEILRAGYANRFSD